MSGNKLKSVALWTGAAFLAAVALDRSGIDIFDELETKGSEVLSRAAAIPGGGSGSAANNQIRQLEVSVGDKYKHYGKTVGMAAVLDNGIDTPPADATCDKAWEKSPKTSAIDWDRTWYNCMPRPLRGKDWTPQGMGGSATTEHYAIDGELASQRSIRLVGQYSLEKEEGLVFPVAKGLESSRLVVFDDDNEIHQTIELVKPAATKKGQKPQLEGLDSHMGGVAWGDYIFVTSGYTISLFNPDDVLKIKDKYVLPRAAHWSMSPRTKSMGRVASGASIDRSQDRNQLVTVGYNSGKGYVYRWDLDDKGLPVSRPSKEKNLVDMVSSQVQKGKKITNAKTEYFYAATHMQGVSSAGTKTYATSSHTKVSNTNDADVLFVKTGNDDPRGYRMPGPNIEGSYFDYQNDVLYVNNEHGEQFMYGIPLEELPN